MKNKILRVFSVILLVILLITVFIIPVGAVNTAAVSDDIVVNVTDFLSANRFDVAIYVPDTSNTSVYYNAYYKGDLTNFRVGSSSYPSYLGRYISFSFINSSDSWGALKYSTSLYPLLTLRDGVYYAYLELEIRTLYRTIELYYDDYSITLNNGDFVDLSLHTDLLSGCNIGFSNTGASITSNIVTIAYPLSYVPDLIGATITFDRELDFGVNNDFNLSLSPFHDFGNNVYNGSRLNNNVFQFMQASDYVNVYDTITNDYFPYFSDVFSIEFISDTYEPRLDTITWLLDNTTVTLYADVPSDSDYDRGFAVGYNQGWNDAKNYYYPYYYQEGYNVGYLDGKNFVVSDEFAKNTIVSVLGAPAEALESITLFQYTLGGTVYTFSVMSLFRAVLGLGLLIIFIKVFAGG